MKSGFEHIPKLIQKYLCDDLNVLETESLQNWRNESEENERIFQRVISVDNFKAHSLRKLNYSTSKGWSSVNAEIEKRKRIRLVSIVMKYAAVVMLPLAITWMLFQIVDENGEREIAEKNKGGQLSDSKVELVLSDGRVVGLKSKNKIIQDLGFKGIVNDSVRGLQYNNVEATGVELEIAHNTLRVPRGGEYQLLLSDGTKVWLNSDSEIKFPVSFTEKSRTVWLKGEAYFAVAHNKDKPFVTMLGDERIEVLGTEFNVSSYEEENKIITTLVKGAVKFHSTQGSNILTPNQQCVYKKEIKNSIIKDVQVDDFIAWRNGRFIFRSKKLDEIMRQLERWYDIQVVYANKDVKNYRFRGEISKSMNINDVLEMISETTNLKFKKENRRVYVLN